MTPRQKQIHVEAKKRIETLKRAEWPLIEILQIVLKQHVVKAAGRPNLYSYLFDLGLSESSAAAFSAVAKKTIEVPQLSRAIKEGLSTTKAVRITSVLTKENADEILSFATKATARDLDRKRAELNPDKRKRASKKPIEEGWSRLALDVSNETLEMIERAQELMSRNQEKSEDEVLKKVFANWLNRHDPVKRAARLAKESKPQKETESIPAHALHVVNDRDKGACVFPKENGHRCKETKFTDIHHIVERSRGGTHEPSNLRTLCAFHHRLVHELSMPVDIQQSWVKAPAAEYRLH